MCPRLVDRPIRSNPIHDSLAATKCPHRQSSSNDLPQASKVWSDAKKCLSPAIANTETSDGLIKDKQRSGISSQVSQTL